MANKLVQQPGAVWAVAVIFQLLVDGTKAIETQDGMSTSRYVNKTNS